MLDLLLGASVGAAAGLGWASYRLGPQLHLWLAELTLWSARGGLSLSRASAVALAVQKAEADRLFDGHTVSTLTVLGDLAAAARLAAALAADADTRDAPRPPAGSALLYAALGAGAGAGATYLRRPDR